MKLAVIETGGKQHVVKEGDVIRIETLEGDLKEGDKVDFDRVLLSDDGKAVTMGEPVVKSAKVSGKLLKEGRDRKISVVRFRSKSRYHKKKGHRQAFMDVEITKIA